MVENPHHVSPEKREAIYSLRIPLKLKNFLDTLDDTQKKSLNHRLMKEMAKAAHDSLFRVEDYLRED